MTTYKVKTPSGWVYIDNQNYDARYILASSKGSNSGVASLDESGHVIFDQLPSSITGAVNYRGVFDPTEGAPSPAAAGYYYVSSGVGTISATSFSTGDWLVYTDGSSWNKIANSSASVTWANVSDKPASYTPDTHDNSSHSESYITTLGVTYEALVNNNDVGDSANQVASGVHTHSGYQPLDGDLTSIAGLSGTAGLLRKTAANTYQLDTNNYLTELTTATNSILWNSQALPSLTGNALKYIRLNAAGSALEFATASVDGEYASKTESDLTLYVYEDATGDADGSSKANAYTTLQDAIDAIPDVAQNVTVIVCKGSTNYLGDTTIIQKASVKSLTIQGEFYAYEACDANAVAGKIVDASADFSDFEVGDRVVCTHYSGTVGSSSIDDYFYATITEVGSGYVQTSEETKVPTTGWKYLINQTVFDGTGLSAGAGVTCDNVGSDLIINGICYEKYAVPTVLINICSIIRINSSIFSQCNSYTIYSTANASIDVNYCAVVTAGKNSRGISLSGNGATSGKVKQTIFQSAYNTSNRCITNGVLGLQCDYVSIFGYNRGFNGGTASSGIYCRFCYISSDCAYGVYGYNVTLVSCTNNATTPVYNLTSGGSIEEWDGQALPSIDDATGEQVLRLKSDKSALEFATVASSYTLPTASADVLGGVKIGSGITITDGVISAASGGGDITGPASTTENKIPQWDSTNKKLKDGLVIGTTSGTIAAGDDSRFTNARTPTAHNLIDTTGHPVSGLTTGHFLKATGATTYGFGAHGLTASDVGAATTSTKLDDFGTPDDNTDLNASTERHGLLPKLGGGTTNFLRADGTWAEPAGGGAGGYSTLVQRSLEGVVYETTLMYWVAPATCSINSVSMALSSNPSATGSYCKVQVMKNGTLETNSIFSADTPMQITELTSASNGIYTASGTLDSNQTTLASGDVIQFRVNQADTGSADLLVQMKVTFT